MDDKNTKKIVRKERWWFGGVASAAAVFATHPLDTIKVLLQTHRRRVSIPFVVRELVRQNGVLSIYWGVSASVMRQLIYSGARFAMFNKISGEMDRRKMKRSFVKDLALATVSGVFGGFLGTPFDIVNVRMQNDAKLPPAMKRNYKHVFDGMYRILRAEGVRTLFKGATLVMGRSIGITIGQIPIYGSVKNFLKSTGYFGEDKKTHFVASSIGGGFATFTIQPIDVVKTRTMNAKPGEYRGIFDVVVKTFKTGGPQAFYKGFIPAFTRLGPHTVITLMTLEQLIIYIGYIPET